MKLPHVYIIRAIIHYNLVQHHNLNNLRAILGLDLGDTKILHPTIMCNILGPKSFSGGILHTDEINSWLEYEGSWKDAKIRTRITNISHYAQSRHQQSDNLHIIEDDSCGCGGSC